MSGTRVLEFLACPKCRERLNGDYACKQCGYVARQDEGLLDFLSAADRPASADAVTAFYEKKPFPGYALEDTPATVFDRAKSSPFLEGLERAIPAKASVIDCGCGTGQLAAFLAIASPSRSVVGVDACRASLMEAARFRDKARLTNLSLIRADIFALPLREALFDVVISRGVVHHNDDPDAAIRSIARLVAPGGYLVLGFYERAARLFHRIRFHLSKLNGNPIQWMDPILRNQGIDDDKKRTWIADQYEHPLEKLLPLPHVVSVLEDAGMEWIRSVPPLPSSGRFFHKTVRLNALEFFSLRTSWAIAGIGDEDAGLISVIARRLRDE